LPPDTLRWKGGSPAAYQLASRYPSRCGKGGSPAAYNGIFLRTLDQEFPGEVPLHLIVDNYGTHKHAKVQAWLQRHPRFVLHFVPTSSSWLNLVERWFGVLDDKAIRRGVFRSVEDLEAAIEAFLTAWNKDPKPFVWTATVESITEKLTRCRRTLESIQPGCTSPRTRKRKK
jgi:transposase